MRRPISKSRSEAVRGGVDVREAVAQHCDKGSLIERASDFVAGNRLPRPFAILQFFAVGEGGSGEQEIVVADLFHFFDDGHRPVAERDDVIVSGFFVFHA